MTEIYDCAAEEEEDGEEEEDNDQQQLRDERVSDLFQGSVVWFREEVWSKRALLFWFVSADWISRERDGGGCGPAPAREAVVE